MNDEATIKRLLMIKTGSVKRLFKEYNMYIDETGDLRAMVDRSVADGAEEWDIKNRNNMLKESQNLVEKIAVYLKKAQAELRELVNSVETDERIAGDAMLLSAKDALQETHTLVDK